VRVSLGACACTERGKCLHDARVRCPRHRPDRGADLRPRTAGNLPSGASKGTLDRIVIAAGQELAHLGVSANCVNPGPTGNGWMSRPEKAELTALTPLGRLGRPRDAANLIAVLCSAEGGWVPCQLLHSNGSL